MCYCSNGKKKKLTCIWSGSNACCWWVVCHRPKHVSLFFAVDMVLPKRSVCDCKKRLFACLRGREKKHKDYKYCQLFSALKWIWREMNEWMREKNSLMFSINIKLELKAICNNSFFHCYFVGIRLLIKTVQFLSMHGKSRNSLTHIDNWTISIKTIVHIDENAFTKLRNHIGRNECTIEKKPFVVYATHRNGHILHSNIPLNCIYRRLFKRCEGIRIVRVLCAQNIAHTEDIYFVKGEFVQVETCLIYKWLERIPALEQCANTNICNNNNHKILYTR